MIIGFDFDNTIINYTNSFKKISQKKKLVPNNFNKNKNTIKNYLIKKKMKMHGQSCRVRFMENI